MQVLNLTGKDYRMLLPSPPRLGLNMGDVRLVDTVRRALPLLDEDY